MSHPALNAHSLQGTYAIPASADGGIPAPSSSSPLPKSPGGGGAMGGSGGGEEAHSPPGPDVDDEESMDWWTKYFASVDAMIEASEVEMHYHVFLQEVAPHRNDEMRNEVVDNYFN